MMPIVHFVNCKSQSAGGMKTVLGYVSQEKKTVREDRKYVTGINCNPQTAYEEMRLTKQLYVKTVGRQYYHLVQSFPKGYDITPEKSLMEKNKPLLQEAAQPVTFAQITEQNWLALIGLLQNLSESQDTMRKMLSRSMTAAQIQNVLDQLSEIAVQGQNACEEIQSQIATEISSAMNDLLSQAGSLSEACSSMLKQQEECSQNNRRRFMKLLLASQSALLILSTALQILLR